MYWGLCRVTVAATALKSKQSSFGLTPRQSTARSCSGGCGSITGDVLTGRAGRLYQPSLYQCRALPLRPRLLMPPPAPVDSKRLTPETGTATRMLSDLRSTPVLLHRVASRESSAQPRLMFGSRTEVHLRQVRLLLIWWLARFQRNVP